MLKPTLAIIATMCLSWGLAFAIQQVRSSSGDDIRVECPHCMCKSIIMPTSVYRCRECGRIQRPVLAPCLNSPE
jgi:hypothetical protein